MRFAQRGHLYDLRTHRYLGAKQQVKTALTGGEPRMYGWLPYRVEGLVLTAAESTRPGGAVKYGVQLAADTTKFAKHVVKIEVFGPDKRKREHYSGTVETRSGKATGRFRLALNDEPGEWRVVATDTFSGRKAASTIAVA